MNKAVPWSIKGVDFDARTAAKEAARRAGMTLGEWLNSVIAEQAAELGIAPDEVDEDERLSAVTSRLQRMSDGGRQRRRTDRPLAQRPGREYDDYEARGFDDEWRQRRPRRSPVADEGREWSSRQWRDPEGFLDEAALRFERMSRRESAHTHAALDHFDRRLAGIESQIDHRNSSTNDRGLQRALSRLETRIEALAAREDSPAANPDASLDTRLTEIAARLKASSERASPPAAAPAPQPAMRSSDLARIEAKLNMLLDGSSASFASAPANTSAATPANPFEAYAPRRSLAASVAEINKRQADLDGGVPLRSQPAIQRSPAPAASAYQPQPGQMAGSAIASLKSGIESLSGRVEEMRSELRLEAQKLRETAQAGSRAQESTPAQSDPRITEGLLELRQHIAAMTGEISQLAPRRAIESLERSIGGLASQMSVLRDDGLRDNIVRPVESLVNDLRHSLSQFEPGSALSAIQNELQTLNRKIGAMDSAKGVTVQTIDPQEFMRMKEQTAEIRNLLAAAAARPLAIDTIEQQIGALGKRVELIANRGSTPQGAAAVTQSVDEIRAILDQALPASALAGLESRIESLSRRFDEFAANSASDNFAAFNERMDALQKAMAWQNEKLPAMRPDNTAVEDLVRSVIARLDAAPAAIKAGVSDASALESSVRDLAAKLEAMSQKPQGEALEAIEEQMRDISARLDGAKAATQALGGIEQSLGDLFTRLEETRLATIDAAENAARAAVRETLAGTGQAAADGGQAKAIIEKEISGLRSLQDAADRRTHATLSAVHETLEKIVDRLAMLESSSEEAQSSTVAPAAMTARAPEPQPGQTLASGPALSFARPEPALPSEAAPPVKSPAPAPSPSQQASAAMRALPSEPGPSQPAQVLREPPAMAPLHPPAVQLENDELLEPGQALPGHRAGNAAPSIFASPGREPDGGSQPPRAPSNTRAEEAHASSSFIAAARRAQQAAQAQAELDARSQPAAKGRLSALLPGDALSEAQSRARAAASALSSSIGRKGRKGKEAAEDGTPEDNLSGANPAGRFGKLRALAGSRKVLYGLAGLVIIGGGANFLMQKMSRPSKPASGVSLPAGRVQANTPAPASAPPSQSASPIAAGDGREAGQFPAPAVPSPASGPSDSPPAPQTDARPPVDRAPVSSIAPDSGSAAAPNNLFAAAAAGDPPALFELGVRLVEGNGVARDAGRGVQLLEQAANNGLAPAQYRLGSIFEKGLGQPKDIAAARKWYQQAAEAGNIRAMHNLGVLIADGGGAKPDYSAAAKWFRQAAEHGIRDSQYNLAILHARGMGVPQNLIDSHVWFALAAAQGDKDAAAKRDDVGKRLSENQLAVARARAVSFTAKRPVAAANDVAAPAGGWRVDAPEAHAPAAPVRPAPGKKRQRVSAR